MATVAADGGACRTGASASGLGRASEPFYRVCVRPRGVPTALPVPHPVSSALFLLSPCLFHVCCRAAWRLAAYYSARGRVPPTVAPFVCRNPFGRPVPGVAALTLCFFVTLLSLAMSLGREKRALSPLASMPRFGSPVLSRAFRRATAGPPAGMRPQLGTEALAGEPTRSPRSGRGWQHAPHCSWQSPWSVLLEAVCVATSPS